MSSKINEEKLIFEPIVDGLNIFYKYQNALCDVDSEYQRITLCDLGNEGLGLFLDGLVQAVEVDEFIYHESLVIPGLSLHPNPTNVLVIGAGDGMAVREVLKDERVECIDLVELDDMVINMSNKYLYELNKGSLENSKVNIIISDCRKYLESSPKKYDVVIVDLIDPYDDTTVNLYMDTIHKLKNVINEEAVICIYAGATIKPRADSIKLYKLLNGIFEFKKLYTFYVESFCQACGVIVVSNSKIGFNTPYEELSFFKNEQLRYISPELLDSLFTLPPYLLKEISSEDNSGKAQTST